MVVSKSWSWECINCHGLGDIGTDKATCSLEWLTEDEAQTLREKKPHAITDIESLEAGDELRVQSPSCFYIAARGSLLRLRFPR